MSQHPAVLVIGLDAADQGLIERWAKDGLLPTFQRLLAEGVSGRVLGPLGIHATAAWESLVTAVSPARHARHSERQIRPRTYNTYRFLPTHLRREAFWEALNRAGRRSAIIDVPYVPLARMNGVHVLDWTAHAANTGFCTWPPTLADAIRQDFGTDPIGLCDHWRLDSTEEFRRFRDQLIARVRTKIELCRELLDYEAWDLFFAVFTEAHCIGHQCWSLHDPMHPRHDAALARQLGDPMLDVYQALDSAVAALLERAGPQTTAFVIASHGMGPYYNGAHLLDAILHGLGHTPPPTPPHWLWQILRWGWRKVPIDWRLRLAPRQKRVVDRLWPPLDRRSTCFNVPNGEVWGAIRVNVAGREPEGCIKAGADLERFCDTLAQDFLDLVNVDTGLAAVLSVRRTRDLYQGPYFDDLPDLLIEWNTAAPLNAVSSAKLRTIRVPFEHPRSGHHTRQGLFVAQGPHLAPEQLAEPVSIMDLAPTLTALLGVHLPDVDGRPIAACTRSGEA
ncbi:MAG TPA: alkaline phosphatase family protein [Candidatus Binatia bacterium]|nr:alkaline phosphatase family protein [Candidatus Binatia bacterium]